MSSDETARKAAAETNIPWLLRCMADDRQQGYALAHHIYKEAGIEKVAAFVDGHLESDEAELICQAVMVDNSVLEMLGDRRAEYGKVRLWGSLGWGVSAVIVGMLIERTGLQWAFYGYIFFMVAMLLTVNRMQISSSPIATGFWQGLRHFAKSRPWIIFLAMAFIIGIAMGVVNNFLLLRLAAAKKLKKRHLLM